MMSFLASLPLTLICDLEQQLGRGDKMILRAVGHSAELLEQFEQLMCNGCFGSCALLAC